MAVKANPWLDTIPAYIPGKHGQDGAIVLSANENAFGASPKVLEYLKSAHSLHRYPDGGAQSLRNAIAAQYGLNADNIVCGAGSDELLQLIARCYLNVGDEAIYSEYGFLVYPIAIKATGATAIKVKEQHYQTDVDAILRAITVRTRLIFLANPNNPTGYLLPTEQVHKLVQALPPNIVVVLDCAYAEYVESADYHQQLAQLCNHPQILITRTFSKIFGLAGLRIGWAVGGADIIAAINKMRGPFNVGHIAQNAAVLALSDHEFLIKSHRFVVETRARLAQSIESLAYPNNQKGFSVLPSHGNFLAVQCASVQMADELLAFLEQRNIMIRGLKSYGMAHFVRITIGTDDENRQLLDGLRDFISQTSVNT